ncbi:MAG: hypothetical protein JO307_34090 [Bryobacterales bacterium]|nr:hypothetical protein [Bryobacterales bacterium]MBV9399620.1 hypothetical protein [Bryobacterales bacterium]
MSIQIYFCFRSLAYDRVVIGAAEEWKSRAVCEISEGGWKPVLGFVTPEVPADRSTGQLTR